MTDTQPRERGATISVVIPTYQREQVLVETVERVLPLLRDGDEVVVVDQTPRHEPPIEEALHRLAAAGAVRWFRKAEPHICQAMNAGACLAQGDILLFLDDDVIPQPDLLEAHRTCLGRPSPPPATCGQVIQPWHQGPVDRVRDFDLEFDPAYNRPCEILTLIGCNMGIRRDVFFAVGGFDENFSGPCYRFESELSFRLFRRLGRKVCFVPEASLIHIKSTGGTRAFGEKDTWRHMGGAMGDYYFALRCLPVGACLAHSLKRLVREPLNRNTVRHPWLIPMLYVREMVAWCRAAGRVWLRPNNYLKNAAAYAVTSPIAATPV